MDDNKSVGYRKDYAGVKALKDIVTASNILDALGGSDGLNTILKKNTRLPCNTCGSNSASYLQPMDEYLQDVKYFADNFRNIDGYDKALKLLKSDGTGNKLEPEAFVIRYLRSEGITNTQGLEVPMLGCEPDLVKSDGTICEFKSWTSGTVPVDDAEEDDAGGASSFQTCFDRLVAGQGSYGQFKNILSLPALASLNKLNYIFDGRKIATADKEGFVKNNFKALLYNSSTNALTAQGEEVWNIFNANKSLLNSIKIQSKSDFVLQVSQVSNLFYSFIQIK